MIERTGRYIGTAIAAVINLLNIQRIVLGGGVMDAGKLILDPIIREAGRRSFQPCFEATQIVAATLGPTPSPPAPAMLARDAAGLVRSHTNSRRVLLRQGGVPRLSAPFCAEEASRQFQAGVFRQRRVGA
jgi:predicted NBD/HSP70 family sugar kinase